jgi:hypothetical protein
MGSFLKTKENEAIYPIYGFDRYYVTNGGEIYENISYPNSIYYPIVEIVEKKYIDNNYYVDIYNNDKSKKFTIPNVKLLAYVKYGDLPFEIKFKDSDTKNISSDNIYYELPKVKYVENNEKVIYLDNIEFRQVPHPHSNKTYYITNDGALYSLKNNILMKRSDNGHGYLRVNLFFDDRYNQRKIHKLVYAAWNNPDQDGKVVDHIDGKKYNNHISNLRLITNSENIRAAHDMNLGPSVWNNEDVHIACQEMQRGGTVNEVAKALNVDVSDDNVKIQVVNFMLSLRNGRVFKDITTHYNLYANEDIRKQNHTKAKQTFDEKDIRKICKLILQGGMSDVQISKIHPQVSYSTVYNIRRGKQYYNIAITIPGMKEYIEEKQNHLRNIKTEDGETRNELISKSNATYSTDTIDQIFEYLYQGYSAERISNTVPNISSASINNIRRGITYSWYTFKNAKMKEFIDNYNKKISA